MSYENKIENWCGLRAIPTRAVQTILAGVRKKSSAGAACARCCWFRVLRFFVDHVENQLCDNDCATYNHLIHDAIIRIDKAHKGLNNKKKLLQLTHF